MAHEVLNLGADNEPREKTPQGWHSFWTTEFEAARKRVRSFHRQGNKVNKRYLDERAGGNEIDANVNYSKSGNAFRLNLFHTNISTMSAMLYGSTPKIEVSREYHDPDDDVARVAGLLFKRILQSDIEASGEDLPTTLRAALQDRLLPGLGLARVRYEFRTNTTTVLNPETLIPEIQDVLEFEDAPIDYVHWQDFLWGWSRTWSEIPWMGFRSFLTKKEATKRFGSKKANVLEYKNRLPTGNDKHDDESEKDQQDNVQKAAVWEFWHMDEKKVFWWSEGADLILDSEDDPLQLDGFWPIPRPMMANVTTTLLMPKADFVIAQDLYNEVDELQTRITIITKACKVVGVYDQSAGASVGRMLKEGVENDLIPVDNWAMFAEKGGLEGCIDWFPVREVAETLGLLRKILAETIQLLYEVTGMSDIIRGANTDQYTSDGTNQLKAKFASIRIQALQDEFARFAGDLEALKAEIISKHFSPESILKQSNAEFMPEADKDKIQQAVELMKRPDIKWRINIRPESIAMVDYAQLKQERTEYLVAMATFLQSAGTMAQQVPESMPILLEFMKFGMAGFKGADYMEGMLDQAIDLAKKAPPKKDDKQGADQAKQQGELAKIEAKLQSDMQVIQAKGQQEMQKIQTDHMANMKEIMAKGQADSQKIMTDLQADLKVIATKLGADIKVEEAQSTFAIAEEQVQHANTIVEEEQSHRNTMTEQSPDG